MSTPVERLVQVMDQLRSPGGCPWDAEQTHQSLAKYLLEETYEALDAMDQGDLVSLREELGDLLLQVVFHARIAQEQDPTFDLNAVAQGVVDKLIRRHPHVFAGLEVNSTAELEANWAAIKSSEKSRESVTDGVPIAMPALQLATQLIYRARDNEIKPVDQKLVSEVEKLVGPVTDETIADILLAVVELARTKEIDPESALRSASMQFRQAIRRSEGLTN
jgi:XTP/dITP diphosphohydrolase